MKTSFIYISSWYESSDQNFSEIFPVLFVFLDQLFDKNISNTNRTNMNTNLNQNQNANPTIVELRHTISPDDLTASNNPRAVISYPLLKGSDYDKHEYAKAVHVPHLPQQAHANYVITDRDQVGVHGLNDTQWHTLMNLLNVGASISTEKLSGTKSLSS